MRAATVLKVAAGVALAVVVGGIALVKSVDVRHYHAVVVEMARAATGRTLEVGRLEFKLSLTPALIAHDVVFANAPWGTRRDLASVRRIEAQVALLPLLRGHIQIRRLVVVEPDMVVETNAQGRGNWQFATGAAAPQASGLPSVDVNEVRVVKARLSYRDGRRHTATNLTLESVTVNADTATGPIGVHAVGAYDQHPFDLSGALGSLAELHAQTKPFPLNLKLASGGLVVVADGSLADVTDAAGLDVKLSAEGKELAEAAALMRYDLPAVGPFRLAARLTLPHGRVALSEIDAAVGRHELALISAKGAVADPLAPGGIDLLVNAEADSLANLSKLVGADLPAVGPVKLAGRLQEAEDGYRLSDFKAVTGRSDVSGELTVTVKGGVAVAARLVSAQLDGADFSPAPRPGEPVKPRHDAKADDGRWFSAGSLPLAGAGLAGASVSGDLSWAATRLVVGGVAVDGADLRASLHHGLVAARFSGAKLGGGQVSGDATIDGRGPQAVFAAKIGAQGVELGAVLEQAGLAELFKGGRTQVAVDVRGAGGSVREVMAHLSGQASVVTDRGQFTSAYVDLMALDVMRELLPWAQSPKNSALQCFVGRFSIANGQAKSEALLLDTAQTTVNGEGSIDLASETLALTLTPRPKEASLVNLAVPLDIGGTLAHPRVGPNAAGLVKSAVGAAAGLALGPAGLLVPFVATGTGDTNSCVAALAQPKKPAKPAAVKAGAARKPATK